ncbi:MAG: helix-turn-helix transcriptional regulator [Burkholderiaceae bacterium]
MHTIENRLLRMPEVLAATGQRKSSYYALAQVGLMPRSVKIGAKAVAVPEQEIRAVNAARIRGASESEIRALVADLHARRAQAA